MARLKIQGPSGQRVKGLDLGAFGGEPECLGADPEMGGGSWSD